MEFETEIQRECQKKVVSEFWNYFQRWKGFFPMGKIEREKYLTWAENIVYKRANAIVSGPHRSHYGEVAGFLAIVGEIKEDLFENILPRSWPKTYFRNLYALFCGIFDLNSVVMA